MSSANFELDAQLADIVRLWASHDVSEADRKATIELLELAKSGDEVAIKTLQNGFAGDLQFGTAGLRGEMAPGPNRMNYSVVTRAAYALSEYLHIKLDEVLAVLVQKNTTNATLSTASTPASPPKVVIGYDARHHSEEFAKQSAKVLNACGCHVSMFAAALPTPVLAFTVKEMGADAGIMVTASHNPGKDNGYKVYLGGRIIQDNAQYSGQGAQIISPADKEIAELIGKAPFADEVPISALGHLSEIIVLNTSEILEKYYQQALSDLPSPSKDINFTVVTTAMHGVGGEIQQKLLHLAGFSEVYAVAEQEDPNPDFPTVNYPNPEEEGALDLSFALAKAKNADIILANDPDADRLAVGCFDPTIGDYRRLTGDEVGIILTDYFINKIKHNREARKEGVPDVIASSIVSSRLVQKMCEASGVEYVTTLTGHKWISRVPNLIFGYEEALGYNAHPQSVRDKDGPSTGVLIACIARNLKDNGQTLLDRLEEIYAKYSRFTQKQLSIRLESSNHLAELVERFRSSLPSEIGGLKVESVIDYKVKPPSPRLTQNAIEVWLGQHKVRLFIRPSGTEPKVKIYLEVQTSSNSDAKSILNALSTSLQQFATSIDAATERDNKKAQKSAKAKPQQMPQTVESEVNSKVV